MFVTCTLKHTHTLLIYIQTKQKNKKSTKIDHSAFYTLHVELFSESSPKQNVHIEPVCTTSSPLAFNIKIIVFIHIWTDEQMLLSHYAKLTAVFIYLHNKTKSLNGEKNNDAFSFCQLINNAAFSLGSEVKRGENVHAHMHSVVQLQKRYSNKRGK